MKNSILISSGLGEEMLSDIRKEKKIAKVTKIIKESLESGKDYEETARIILDQLFKEDKKYD